HRAGAAAVGVGARRVLPVPRAGRPHGLHRLQETRPSRTYAFHQFIQGDGTVGESPSARTDRELEALRSTIDSDVRMLRERLREDIDPRRLARRNPIAVVGTLGSVLAIGTVGTVRALAERRRRRSDTDVDALIARMGGRID